MKYFVLVPLLLILYVYISVTVLNDLTYNPKEDDIRYSFEFSNKKVIHYVR